MDMFPLYLAHKSVYYTAILSQAQTVNQKD